MEKSTGIILKTYFPKKRKIAVLTHEGDKAFYVPDTENVSAGIIIQFYAWRPPFIHGIEKMAVPLALAHEDILFLHHLLELCYYFIPAGSRSTDAVFNLVQFLLTQETGSYSVLVKKLILVKLFGLLGVVPDTSTVRLPFLYQLVTTPVDTLVNQVIDLETEYALDSWLDQCIALHPYYEHFKTAHFLAMHRKS